MSFWSQKIKKEIRAFLYPLQPDVGEEKEKEKEKKKEKEVGDWDAPVDCVAPWAPKRRLCEGALHRPEPRRAFHNYGPTLIHISN